MCVSGKVRAVNTTQPNFTTNQEYPILGFTTLDGASGDVWAIVIDDNGDVVVTEGDINGNQFSVTELYATAKVI